MGRLVKNEHLNYWLCGLIFSIMFAIVFIVVTVLIGMVGLMAGGLIALIAYVVIMPYITGWLVDYVSDKWMD